MTDGAPVHELDCRGLACPQPVLDLARTVGGLTTGERVLLLADDPAARTDVAVWCRMKRHTLAGIEAQEADGARWLAFDVVVG